MSPLRRSADLHAELRCLRAHRGARAGM